MERLHFSIHIDAPLERAWRVLWDDATYTQWTARLGAGSRVVSGDGLFNVFDD